MTVAGAATKIYASNMFDTKELALTRAAQFQALADPVRLQIVAVLGTQPRCVCEIQSAVGPIAANLLSYHLGILRGAGLVTAQRRGRWIDYSLKADAFSALRASLPQPVQTAQATLEMPCDQVGGKQEARCALPRRRLDSSTKGGTVSPRASREG